MVDFETFAGGLLIFTAINILGMLGVRNKLLDAIEKIPGDGFRVGGLSVAKVEVYVVEKEEDDPRKKP
jgi:hypothetical protein